MCYNYIIYCFFLRIITHERKYCFPVVKPSVLFEFHPNYGKYLTHQKATFLCMIYFFRFVFFKLWKINYTLNKILLCVLYFFQKIVKTIKKKIQCQHLHSGLTLSVYSWSILSMYIKIIKQSS